MTDITESDPLSSSENNGPDIKDDAPMAKKRKIVSENEQCEKLEHRLCGILCCAVCLELPPAAVYQCTNGHLMCAPCFTHLLADARLRDEAATCPNCRVAISASSASRNLAVEKTVSELPSECRYCARLFPRHALRHHEDNLCNESIRCVMFCSFTSVRERAKHNASSDLWTGNTCRYTVLPVQRSDIDCRPPLSGMYNTYGVYARDKQHHKNDYNKRYGKVMSVGRVGRVGTAACGVRVRRVTGCKYACIGCTWRGPAHEARGHEAGCAHPARSAADLVELLAERERRAQDAAAVHEQILDLLSYEKITVNDLQLKPYHTEEPVNKLYYESARFSAFGHQWVVKAFVNRDRGDPTQSAQRDITYQLILKSKAASALGVQWVCARGPWGEARMAARVAAHTFRDEAADSPPLPLPLAEPRDANRLLAARPLHCR
ncbi:Cysteine and histidine-rich protein 1-like [Papilio xuthus]|uniref:Cysteine and histidine-rich protein 1-like n=1 Tax=Papilio xuthus TaxID=66420 RepID=A0A194PP31_PAPXU|nr:Cysteine and histidine-rich protein 1-like [Papilio xuthus]